MPDPIPPKAPQPPLPIMGEGLDWRAGLRDAFNDKTTLATLAMGVNDGAFPLTDHGAISWSDWLVEVVESYARKRPALASPSSPEGMVMVPEREVPPYDGQDGCPWCASPEHWAGIRELCPNAATAPASDLRIEDGE